MSGFDVLVFHCF